jgi:hypothetical protein
MVKGTSINGEVYLKVKRSIEIETAFIVASKESASF